MIDRSAGHLAKDAAKARKLGLSYGQYKALELEDRLPEVKVPDFEKKKEAESGNDGVDAKRCCICGRAIPSRFRRTYCSDECAMHGKRAYARKLWHRKNGKK